MNIGDKVRDITTGFRGVVTAETTWQGGRQTLHVQPTVDAQGNFREGKWIEAALLEPDTTPDIAYFGNGGHLVGLPKDS